MPPWLLASDDVVDKPDLEGCLAQARATCREPTHGIHGLGTVGWQVGREAVNFLGAGRATILQLAHPGVAHAIDQHSTTRADPRQRFRQTFHHVFRMTFGTIDQAIASARRVHAIHQKITGTIDEAVGQWPAGKKYYANDRASLRWVWATLVDTVLVVQDASIGPLSLELKCAYFRESRRFALLFGLDASDLPGDYFEFKHYMNQMLVAPELCATVPARALADFIFSAPNAALAPLMKNYRRVTSGFLPDRLRREFGFSWRPSDRIRFQRDLALIGRTLQMMPSAGRFLPAYSSARVRLGAPTGWLARRAATLSDYLDR